MFSFSSFQVHLLLPYGSVLKSLSNHCSFKGVVLTHESSRGWYLSIDFSLWNWWHFLFFGFVLYVRWFSILFLMLLKLLWLDSGFCYSLSVGPPLQVSAPLYVLPGFCLILRVLSFFLYFFRVSDIIHERERL